MLLQDDPLVDVFVFLCRSMLDILEITNRRFKVVLRQRTKGVCLRALEVAELLADARVTGLPDNSARLVTAPAAQRDGGFRCETNT